MTATSLCPVAMYKYQKNQKSSTEKNSEKS